MRAELDKVTLRPSSLAVHLRQWKVQRHALLIAQHPGIVSGGRVEGFPRSYDHLSAIDAAHGHSAGQDESGMYCRFPTVNGPDVL